MSEGKENMPKIRFPGFTGAWEQVKLESVASFSKGHGYSKSDLRDEGTPIILYGRLYTKYETSISEVDTFVDAKSGSVYSKGGEVIIPASGETAEDIARAAIVKDAGVLLGGDLNVITPDSNVDSVFLALSISNGNPQKELAKKAQGKSVVHIHNEEIKELIISFPKQDEQKQISTYFANLDNLITLHQRKLNNVKKLKSGLLQKMFPKNGECFPEIRFPGFTDAWEQHKLEDVAKYRNGKAHENDIDENGKYIVINSKFVSTDGKVQKCSNLQNEPLYENEIAFVLSDVPNGRAIARTYLVEKSDRYSLNQRIAGITPLENTYPYFLHILMNRNRYFLQFDDGAKQTNLSVDDVMKFEEYYPQVEEQQAIGDYFRNLDKLITLHQRELEHLQKLKKSLLQQMFV